MKILEDLKEQLGNYYDLVIALLPRLLVAILVVIVLMISLKYLKKGLIKFLMKRADDKLLINFVSSFFQIIIVIVNLLIFLYIVGLGAMAGSLLAAVGVSAFVIGFALKDIGENFLAGVMMAFDRPFRLGDTVLTGVVEGNIVQMSLRETHIKTSDGKDVYVPNGQILKNPLYNYTIDGFIRGQFIVGVDYENDIEAVRSIIMHELKNLPGILKEERPPRTHVTNLNTSTVDIEVFYWIDTFDKKYAGLEVKSMAQTKILKALKSKNIGMPADIVELKNYDDSFKFSSNSK